MRVTLVFLVGLVMVASGCGGPRATSSGATPTADGDTVDIKVSDGSARLVAGEILRVDLGQVNSSIGDSWHLVSRPDPAVLTEKERQYDSDDPGCIGCGGHLKWTFAAVGVGTTTIVFRYCYRSQPDNCQAGPGRGPQDPVSLSVTVS